MRKKIIGIFVITLLIATVLPTVSAMDYKSPNKLAQGLITIKITSKVYELDDPYNLLNGVIKVDGGIGGHYTYDSGTPDTVPDENRLGEYRMTSSSCLIALNAGGGFLFKTNPSNVDMGIHIYDNLSGRDLYRVFSCNNLQLPNGMLVDDIQWTLEDYDESFFSSDALPTTAPVPLTEWDKNELYIRGENPSNPSQEYYIHAHVTSAKKEKAVNIYGSENNHGTSSVKIPYSYPFLQILVDVFQRFPDRFPILRHFLGY